MIPAACTPAISYYENMCRLTTDAVLLINVATPFEIWAYVLSAFDIIFIEDTNVMKVRKHVLPMDAIHASGSTTAIEVPALISRGAAIVASDPTTVFDVRTHIFRAG